jgi:RNA polymerase sigma-70 factor (ECF subfamily)
MIPSNTDHAATFTEYRPLLFSIAYRMLGSASDAEDIVQDAFLRWQRVDVTQVVASKAYLSAMVTRLALDHLESARVRGEVYVGPWLPEPLVGVTSGDPVVTSTLADSLSTAFLLLLERLAPRERAAFLLREVFDFDYAEVARILGITAANARQIVRRAKQRVAAGRPVVRADTRAAEELAERFLATCLNGDIDALLAMLAADATAWADGGGKFAAARLPIHGADRVARFVSSIVRKWAGAGTVQIAPVNGGVGLLFSVSGEMRAVMTVDAAEGAQAIAAVFVVVNPEKLTPQRHM